MDLCNIVLLWQQEVFLNKKKSDLVSSVHLKLGKLLIVLLIPINQPLMLMSLFKLQANNNKWTTF